MSSTEVYRIEIPITVEDNYTEEIQKAEKAILALQKQLGKDVKVKGIKNFDNASKSASNLEKEVKKVKTASAAASKEVAKVSDNVDKQMSRVEKRIQEKANVMQRIARRKQMIEIGVRDRASRTIGYVQSKLNNIRNAKVVTFTISAIDRATRVIGGIKRSITSIPAMVTIALSYVGVKNFSDATVGAAMKWEEYEVSMTHWLGGNVQKAKELTKWMGQFADTTPFSSAELFPALTNGISITNGDVKKAQRLLKITSDMAALTPGRTVEDAMLALGNAQMGDFEMMKGFGMQITKDKLKQMGGYDGFINEVEKSFKDGAVKLSKTASGILATLNGYRSSLMRAIGTGFLEPMKPRLDKINQWLENNQETWGGWKQTVSDAGKAFSDFVFTKGENLFNYLNGVFNSPENKDLTIGAKIKILASDTKSYIKNWWDSSGEQLMIDTGTLMGEAILKGMGVALKAGVGLLGTLWGDVGENRKDHGLFSKETGGSLLKFGGASLLAGWGAMKVLKPFISGFKGAKSLWGSSKNIRDKFRGTKVKETTSNKPTGGKSSEQSKQRSTSYKKDKTKSKSFKNTLKGFEMPKGLSKWTKRIPILGAALSMADGLSGVSSWSGVAGSAGGGWAGASAGASAGAFLGPAGAAVGGIGGGILGSMGGKAIGDWFSDSWDSIKDGASATGSWISDKFNSAVDWTKDAWDATANWFTGSVWEPISNGAKNAGQWVGENFSDGVGFISDKWSSFSGWFEDSVWTPISDSAIDTMNFMVGLFDMGRESASEKWSDFSQWFNDSVWEPIKMGAAIAGLWIADKYSEAKDWVSENWSAFSGWFEESVWTPVKEGASIAGQWISDRYNDAKTWAQESWTSFSGWFEESVWSPVKEGALLAGQWISDRYNDAKTQAQESWSSFSGWFEESVWTPVKEGALIAGQWISDRYNEAKGSVEESWGAVSGWFEETVWAPIKSGAETAAGWISSTFDSAKESITGAWNWAKGKWNDVSTWTSSVTKRGEEITGMSPSKKSTKSKKSVGPVRSGGGYVPYANGGLINRPHMGLVGEAGPEAIIPLSPSRRGRGRELLYRAASALGVQPYADGGLVGGNIIEGYGDISTGKTGPSISIGDILPQVQITVQANENGHVDLSNVSDEILDQIGVKLANKVMEAASNMMVG